MENTYTFEDHIHNFAVWTSARAVARNFTGTENINISIENSELRDFSESLGCESQIDFDKFHKRCANQIIKSLINLSIPNVSYGIAAKIIAIYLKTTVILTKPNLTVCDWIHPPIDATLLENLSKEEGNRSLLKIRWTLLTEKEYWDMCQQIKSKNYAFNWTLEQYWNPEQ